jgi:hypothetical protein
MLDTCACSGSGRAARDAAVNARSDSRASEREVEGVGDERTIRVVVERRRRRSRIGEALLVLIALGLAVEYWYISLAVLAGVGVIALVSKSRRGKQKAAVRSGRQDPWLNEVAVALADFDLTEIARNTGAQLGGAPVEADIGLSDKRITIYATLFGSDALARQAEVGLRAQPKVRESTLKGRTAIASEGRVLYVASTKSGVVDEFRLQEVMRAVGEIALPPSLPPPAAQGIAQPIANASAPEKDRQQTTSAQFGALGADALEQLRKLGELKERGVLTEEEFASKKAELLRRI